MSPQIFSPSSASYLTPIKLLTCLYGSLKLEKDRLRNEDLARLRAKKSDLRFKKLHLLAGSATANFEKAVDDGV